jgi:hypothetical protein
MLYIVYGRKQKTKTDDTRRRTQEKPYCGSRERRRNRSIDTDCREGEPASIVFRSRRDKTCYRKTLETITCKERDRKLREQQPTPNQAFLVGGKHG